MDPEVSLEPDLDYVEPVLGLDTPEADALEQALPIGGNDGEDDYR